MNYKIFETKEQVAVNLAQELFELFQRLDKEKINLAISGGTTPYILFDEWAKKYNNKINWQKLHFFWVDERCVAPDSSESNYGNTKKSLFDAIAIPAENVHRIRGEVNPQEEAQRYAKEIEQNLPKVQGIPQFDVVLLGMGDDGHTASIFPPSIELMHAEKFVEATQNPYSHQNRITLTGKVINQAFYTYFLVTGETKTQIVHEIFNKESGYEKYPATHIKPKSGKLCWVFDAEAAQKLV
jgi:6-phosphogluconolactonase